MPVDSNKSNVSNTGTDYPVVPEDVYVAELVDVTLKEGIKTQWGLKDKFYFYFGILNDSEQRGARVLHTVSTAFNAGFQGGQPSGLYKLSCALTGETLDDKEGIDVNTLIGKRAKLVIKVSQKDGKTYANVAETMKATVADILLKDLTDSEKKAIMPNTHSNRQDEGEAETDTEAGVDIGDPV